MNITRSFDVAEIDKLLKDQSVFSRIIDDYSPEHELFSSSRIVNNRSNIALIVTEGDERIGCFICLMRSPTTYEGHICLTNKCRGKKALKALSLAAGWIFINTDAFRILGLTPESNKAALSITRLAGYERIGVREAATSISGAQQNVVMSELSIYKWINSQNIESHPTKLLDHIDLKYLYISRDIIKSGNLNKALYLLAELAGQSYSKRINVSDYPMIKVDSNTININQLFKE